MRNWKADENVETKGRAGRQGRQPNASYRSVAAGKVCRKNKLLQACHAEEADRAQTLIGGKSPAENDCLPSTRDTWPGTAV